MIDTKINSAELQLELGIVSRKQTTNISENLNLGEFDLEEWSVAMASFFHSFMSKMGFDELSQVSAFIHTCILTSHDPETFIQELSDVVDIYSENLLNEDSEHLSTDNVSVQDIIERLEQKPALETFDQFVEHFEQDESFQHYVYKLYQAEFHE